MLIAGIDPGTNGAIAVLDSESPDSVALLDLKKNSICDIWNWLHSASYEDHCEHVHSTQNHLEQEYPSEITIWVEDVHSMFGM